MNLNEKLEKLSGKESSQWLEKAEWRRQNRGWLKKSAAVALKVLQELRRQGMTQKDLAERMAISAQQVNKIVKGQENLTLETLDKLEKALNIQLLHDSQAVSATVLNFEPLPVMAKGLGGMHEFFFQKQMMNSKIECMKIHHSIVGLCSAKLHTHYPIVGKETWLRLHSEHS